MMLFAVFAFWDMVIYDNQVREVVRFSQLSVCTKDGESVMKTNNVDGSPLFYVSAEMERIYICGSVETPRAIFLSIGLYAINGEEENQLYSKTSTKPLPSGQFIFDLRSTEKLELGKYRVRLRVGRIDHGDIRFLMEK
jgi:hypothetical protein